MKQDVIWLEDITQNLKDAGCSSQVIDQFFELSERHNTDGQFRLLMKHRSLLLDRIHTDQKQIDCLDYLIYRMKKERTMQ